MSDLHLHQDSPINDAFIAVLHDLTKLTKLQGLFILGDFLDSWIGESDIDHPKHWLAPIFTALQQLTIPIYVMRGNRDFMIDQRFCDCFSAKLIHEPFFLYRNGQTYRLEHGDKLCTDDKAYQRYRAVIRHPITHTLLQQSPNGVKRWLKTCITTKAARRPLEQKKQIDTNQEAVQQALDGCDHLIHGHTHKPHLTKVKQKSHTVLGDWYCDNGCVRAVFAVLGDELLLVQQSFSGDVHKTAPHQHLPDECHLVAVRPPADT